MNTEKDLLTNMLLITDKLANLETTFNSYREEKNKLIKEQEREIKDLKARLDFYKTALLDTHKELFSHVY